MADRGGPLGFGILSGEPLLGGRRAANRPRLLSREAERRTLLVSLQVQGPLDETTAAATGSAARATQNALEDQRWRLVRRRDERDQVVLEFERTF